MINSPLRFIKSGVFEEDYPVTQKPEVALVGRSNAGKSSLINSLGQQKIAFVSQHPGKTQWINFFEWKKCGILVDLPGYGYAKRSKKTINDWKLMVETYLTKRSQLRGLLIVADVWRDLTDQEQMIFDFCDSRRISLALVLTKIDQLNSAEKADRLKYFSQLSLPFQIFWVSNLKKIGVNNLRNFLIHNWFR